MTDTQHEQQAQAEQSQQPVAAAAELVSTGPATATVRLPFGSITVSLPQVTARLAGQQAGAGPGAAPGSAGVERLACTEAPPCSAPSKSWNGPSCWQPPAAPTPCLGSPAATQAPTRALATPRTRGTTTRTVRTVGTPSYRTGTTATTCTKDTATPPTTSTGTSTNIGPRRGRCAAAGRARRR